MFMNNNLFNMICNLFLSLICLVHLEFLWWYCWLWEPCFTFIQGSIFNWFESNKIYV